jgi:hypothetical protein
MLYLMIVGYRRFDNFNCVLHTPTLSFHCTLPHRLLIYTIVSYLLQITNHLFSASFHRLWALGYRPLSCCKKFYSESSTTLVFYLVSSPILSLDLPDSIPVLNTLGSNWQLFSTSFEKELRARRLWSHFDGSVERPCNPGAEVMKNLWEKSERNARYLLSERLCDSLCLKTGKLQTAAARWELLERSYGRPVNILAEVLPPRRAEEMEKVSPESKKQSGEGATYQEKELAAVAKISSPKDVRAAVAFNKADEGVAMGGMPGLEVDCNVDFVEVTGDRCKAFLDDCDLVGDGIFELVDEDPDFEGVWSCNELPDYMVVSDDGTNNDDVPVFDHPPFPCPFPDPEFDSPAAAMADEDFEDGPDAWNDRLAVAGRGEDKIHRVLSYVDPPAVGWAAEGAGSVPEEPKMTESVGKLPCNTLGVPMKAAVIARDRTESKVDAPNVGWAEASFCGMQMVPPPLETEGLPCEAEGVLDDIPTPLVCAEAHTRSWDLDKAARGMGWSQDATRAVALGTGSAAGHQTDTAEYGDAQDSPLDIIKSLVDLGDVAQDAPGHVGRLSKVGVPLEVAQDVPGQDGRLSKAGMLLDVARDAPERFTTVVKRATRREAKRLWNERHKFRVRSEGERCVGSAGGMHATCAGSRQRKRPKFEITHLVYPESHSLCRRHRRRYPMPRGRPPDANNRCAKVCVGAGALDACGKHNPNADMSEAMPSHVEGLQWPVFAIPKPIGCPVRARELFDVNPAAWSARRAPSTQPVAVMENRPGRPPELEGKYLERGRRMANSIRARSVQKPTKTISIRT